MGLSSPAHIAGDSEDLSSMLKELAREWGIKYDLPSLAELEDKPENRKWLGAMIDAEGTIDEQPTVTKKTRQLKVYRYTQPRIRIVTTSPEIAEEVRLLTGAYIGKRLPERPGWKVRLVPTMVRRTAIAALLLTLPYLIIPEKIKRAKFILNKYRERFLLPVG